MSGHIVGVTLPGTPREGDPQGMANTRVGTELVSNQAVGVILRTRIQQGILWARLFVLSEGGMYRVDMPRDESKLTPNSWFVLPEIP